MEVGEEYEWWKLKRLWGFRHHVKREQEENEGKLEKKGQKTENIDGKLQAKEKRKAVAKQRKKLKKRYKF